MGVVFQKQGQKTLYVAGDTIWCDEVKTAIDKFSPSVIIANLGGVSLFIDGKSQLEPHHFFLVYWHMKTSNPDDIHLQQF